MTNQEIIKRGELIRDETVTGANTAQRVGEAFVAIGENLKEQGDSVKILSETVLSQSEYIQTYNSSVLTRTNNYWAGANGSYLTSGVKSDSRPFISSEKIQCKEGDTFTIIGTATDSAEARLVIIIDAANVVIGRCAAGTLTNSTITAPAGAANFVMNSREDSVASFSVIHHREAVSGLEENLSTLETKVSELEDQVNDVESIAESLTDIFITEEIDADVADVESLSSGNWHPLSKLENGEYGIEEGVVTNTSNTYGQTWGIYVSADNTKTYNLAAAVFTGIDIDEIQLNTSNGFAFCASLGISQNRNTFKSGKIRLSDGNILVYIISQTVTASGNSSLPTVCGARLLPNTSAEFGIKKIVMAYLDVWDEEKDLPILIRTATDDSKKWVNGDLFVRELDLSNIGDLVNSREKTFPGIAFWGSSTIQANWIKKVAEDLNMPYYWGGVGGESIRAISMRMGVIPMFVVNPFIIPASSNTPVNLTPNIVNSVNYHFATKWVYNDYQYTFLTITATTWPKMLINPCYIAGVKGNIILNNGNIAFQRVEDGSAVTTKAYEPVYTFGFRETRDCVWFLACHYNGGYTDTEQMVKYYRRMYDMSESKKVIVMGRHRCAGNGTIESPTLASLQEEEAALEKEFGLMFLNIREWMCTVGVQTALADGNTLSQTDLDLAAQGVIPDAFYSGLDNVHFNTLGYNLLTKAVEERIIHLGYNLYRGGGEMNHPTYD